jgi:hypothetical protein
VANLPKDYDWEARGKIGDYHSALPVRAFLCPHAICKQTFEEDISMDPKIRASFEGVSADVQKRLDESNAAQARQADKRLQFVANFSNAVKSVIVPALEEVAELLRNQQWRCNILHSDGGASLEIYRGNMSTQRNANVHPNIAFVAHPDTMLVRMSAESVISQDARDDITLQQINSEFIQEEVLKFFTKLAKEKIS